MSKPKFCDLSDAQVDASGGPGCMICFVFMFLLLGLLLGWAVL